ncbi:MAG: hypothetical protein LBC91_03930, partial [Candidatus Accumulibacter sp.]|nr:hypothetical protein [Accumulibacter sp.]
MKFSYFETFAGKSQLYGGALETRNRAGYPSAFPAPITIPIAMSFMMEFLDLLFQWIAQGIACAYIVMAL